jgi:hypothetical protein
MEIQKSNVPDLIDDFSSPLSNMSLHQAPTSHDHERSIPIEVGICVVIAALVPCDVQL